jgi:hypothetical protein
VPIEPKEGGTFREEWFDSVNRVLTPGTITIFDPPSKLTVAWAVDDWPGDTVVTFSFGTDNNGTRLLSKHSGLKFTQKNKCKI